MPTHLVTAFLADCCWGYYSQLCGVILIVNAGSYRPVTVCNDDDGAGDSDDESRVRKTIIKTQRLQMTQFLFYKRKHLSI